LEVKALKHHHTTRRITVGSVPVGGGAPIAVQSMTNTDTRDPASTLGQIDRLVGVGCEVVRVAVADQEAAEALKRIVPVAPAPLIADIHFDHRLALSALAAGVAGLRINPGNIGGAAKVKKLAAEAKSRGAPIRVGVNAGSLEKELLAKYGRPTPEALVESALSEIHLLESAGFQDIKISLKSSSVLDTVAAYRLISEKVDYPLHLGVTEAGTLIAGTVKSALGIGMLLAEGIGDTLRVSLTRDPVDEVRVAWEILRALGLRRRGPEIIACPTCGRTEIDLFSLVEQVERDLARIDRPIKVAVMGCVVNGPGEAREADVGVAGGRGSGLLFKKGQIIEKIPENQLARRLVDEARRMVDWERNES
jgi:(E)-4-hydroxy-3-methylbut-2-enyl-diphosphate synthase